MALYSADFEAPDGNEAVSRSDVGTTGSMNS